MSIVTAGAGNFASDWAMALNYGGIEKVSSTGEKTRYNPEADTNIARGDALQIAVSSLVSGDTLKINGSLQFDLGSAPLELIGLDGVSLVGLDNPIIKCDTVASGYAINVDKDSTNVNLVGLTVYAVASDLNYVGGHKYALIHNGSGKVSECQIILHTDVTAIQATFSFKTLVHLGGGNLEVSRCVIATMNEVVAMTDQVLIGAFHALDSAPTVLGSDHVAIIHCNFLSQNISDERMKTTPISYIGCSSNIDGLGGLTYLNLPNASSLINPVFDALIDPSFYATTWAGIDKSTYRATFQVLAGTGDIELFRIYKTAGSVVSYEIKLSDDSGCFWHGYVRAGIVDTLSGSLTDGFTKYAVDVTDADNHIYSVTKDGGTNRNAITVYYLPTQQRNTDGTISNTSDIVLSDVEE